MPTAHIDESKVVDANIIFDNAIDVMDKAKSSVDSS